MLLIDKIFIIIGILLFYLLIGSTAGMITENKIENDPKWFDICNCIEKLNLKVSSYRFKYWLFISITLFFPIWGIVGGVWLLIKEISFTLKMIKGLFFVNQSFSLNHKPTLQKPPIEEIDITRMEEIK